MKRDRLLTLLPDAIAAGAAREDDLLTALLDVMALMHARDEEILTGFDRYLDPYRAPEAAVYDLSAWVDLSWLFLDPPDDPYAERSLPFAGDLGALRELLLAAAPQSPWRGTARGLVAMLELATWTRGFRVEEPSPDDPAAVAFAIRVVVPAAAAMYLGLVERIVDHEKPAHVSATIELDAKPHDASGD